MSIALLFAIALLPGLVSWWSGRGLLAMRDDPALAERFLAHNRRVYLLAFVVLIGVGVALSFEENKPLAAVVAVLPLFATLAGGFPLRRTLYDESWNFPTYLVFMFRLLVGAVGFWMVLLATPYLVMSAGELRWIAAAVLGLLLALWNRVFSAALIRIVGARPLPSEDGRFSSYFAAVDERSSVPPPQRWVMPVPGGRLVNALALASARQPRVIFSSSLLELLEPDEVGAIYAHEVGHLEYFRDRRLRNLGIVVHAITAAAVPWSLLPWSDRVLQTITWPFLFIVLARLRARWMRGHETETDLRAVELCGDADALIRALVRLHRLMLLPRRLALETEKAMTHPSLARRIQAIRERAGRDDEGSGGTESTSAPAAADGARPPPLFLRTGRAGACLLLESERLSWFEGVPAELGPEAPAFDALHRSAASSHTLVYGQLAELRLEVRRAKTALVAVDSRGGKRRFDIASGDVAALQRRLDEIDARLGKATAQVASKVARPWHRLLAAAAAVSSFLPPVAGAASVPALFALVRPRPASLTAAGLAGLAASVYRTFQIPVHPYSPDVTTLSAWLLGLVSLPLLVTGIRGSRQAPEERGQTAWPLAATCWVLTAIAWGVILQLSALGGTLDVFRLSWLLYWAPSALVLPLSAAAALFFVRDRRFGRASFVLTSALVLVPLAATTTAFRDALTDDPLVPRGPVPAGGRLGLREVARRELDFRGSELRLSPSGETWAISESTGWGLPESLTWKLGRLDGSPLPAGTAELAEVTDLAFVDDERLVLLRRENAPDGGAEYGEPDVGLLLVRQRLGAGEPRSIRLSVRGDYESRLAASGETWRVVTDAYQRQRHLLRRYTGRWTDDEIEETVWELGDVETGWSRATAGRGEDALVVRTPVSFASPLGRSRSRILALSAGSRERSIVSTALDVDCEIHPPSEMALCIARDRSRTYLWRIDPAGGAPEAVGSYRSPDGEEVLAAEEGVLFLTPYGPSYWLEHAGGRLFELEWPSQGRRLATAAAGAGVVAELREARNGQGGSVLILFRARS